MTARRIFVFGQRLAFGAAILLVACYGTSPLYARQDTTPPAPQPATAQVAPTTGEAWRARMDAALASPVLQNAQVGVSVRFLGDNRVLYEKNADFALVPASNMKIVTALAAVTTLGTDFRFATNVHRVGDVDKNGVLNGDLYLKGTGDPSLSSERLREMARAVRGAGIKRIKGRIVYDASRFDDRALGDGWQWDDEPYSYQAQVSALNCDENVVRVTVAPGKTPGDAGVVTIGGPDRAALGFDKSAYVSVVSTVTTTRAGASRASVANISFDRTRGKNEIRVSGTIPVGALAVSESVTVEEPARYAAHRFADLLTLAGVRLPGADKRRIEAGVVPATAALVHESRSAFLPDLLTHFMKASDNLYGETLLKAVGAATAKNGKGTTANGALAVRALCKAASVPANGLSIADGSGLSRLNTVTPRLLVGLLTHAQNGGLPPAARDAFTRALPVGGVDGTLRNRFKGAPAENRVQAKTGTLTGASSLSGYVTTRAGERLVFSVVMNNYASAGSASAARTAQDALVNALMDVPAKGE